MSSTLHHDELTSTVFGAIQQLNQHRKASFLLDTALALIDAGQWVVTTFALLFWIQIYFVFLFRYGAEVENYLEVYLRTPGLSKSDVTRALLARGSARKQGGESLLVKAEHGTVVPPSSTSFEFFIFWYRSYRFSNRLETWSSQQRTKTSSETPNSTGYYKIRFGTFEINASRYIS